MRTIFRYFAITSLVAIMVTAGCLSAYLRERMTQALIEEGELHNVAITQVFVNALGPELPTLMARLSHLSPSQLASDPAAAKLSRELRRVTRSVPASKVAIYNWAGAVVVSTEPEGLGEDQSRNPGFISAKAGQVVSRLIYRHTPSPFDAASTDYDMIESYVPMDYDDDNDTDGVLEMHLDVTSLRAKLAASQRDVLAGVAIALAVLYGALILIVRYADIMLRRHERTITERTRELEESQRFIQSLFDAETGGIVVVDRTGHVVNANKSAQAVAIQEPVGRAFAEVFPAHNPQCAIELAQRTFETGLTQQGECVCHLAGARVLSIVTTPVLDAGGRSHLVILRFRDVTEQKQLEIQWLRQEKVMAFGVLAAGLAHDIGNPLASLASELQMAEQETDPAQLRHSLGVMNQLIGRMAGILREMRDFARGRSDGASEISLPEAVNATVRSLRYDPRAPRIEIATELADDLPNVLMVKNHLSLILVNLLLNAFDAMEEQEGGRVVIAVRNEKSGGVVVQVRDTGPGMTPETLARATEGLYTTKSRGMGLGLTVNQEMMRALGGRVELASHPGHGTTVTLVFPASRCKRRVTEELKHG